MTTSAANPRAAGRCDRTVRGSVIKAMSAGHLGLVVAVVGAALAFDFINGFHDAANSIATIVSTRVLTPFRAVLWAAFFNFIAFALFKLHVASTIGQGDQSTPRWWTWRSSLARLAGAIAWNLLTWCGGCHPALHTPLWAADRGRRCPRRASAS